MNEECELCGTQLVETGPPIWEDYCPNPDCNREKLRISGGIRAILDQRDARRVELVLDALAHAATSWTMGDKPDEPDFAAMKEMHRNMPSNRYKAERIVKALREQPL